MPALTPNTNWRRVRPLRGDEKTGFMTENPLLQLHERGTVNGDQSGFLLREDKRLAKRQTQLAWDQAAQGGRKACSTGEAGKSAGRVR